MDFELSRGQFSAVLARDVGRLLLDDTTSAGRLLARFVERGGKAVVFGGAIRTLAMHRFGDLDKPRPRDIDLVVADDAIEMFTELAGRSEIKRNRFGGMKILHEETVFDLWPLSETWAFKNDQSFNPSFQNLPETTFLNMEAIAISLDKGAGNIRQVYDGNGEFFEGCLNNQLELNFEPNPFPALCVVRSIVMAAELGFALGPKLINFVVKQGAALSEADVQMAQVSHYGVCRLNSCDVVSAIRNLTETPSGCRASVLWPTLIPFVKGGDSYTRQPK